MKDTEVKVTFETTLDKMMYIQALVQEQRIKDAFDIFNEIKDCIEETIAKQKEGDS